MPGARLRLRPQGSPTWSSGERCRARQSGADTARPRPGASGTGEGSGMGPVSIPAPGRHPPGSHCRSRGSAGHSSCPPPPVSRADRAPGKCPPVIAGVLFPKATCKDAVVRPAPVRVPGVLCRGQHGCESRHRGSQAGVQVSCPALLTDTALLWGCFRGSGGLWERRAPVVSALS